jgi:8-oxo-dGTP pyrophosphatase MutT (NUDIX family)
MWAAASGHSTLGIPSSVGKEFAEADPGGKLPARAKDNVPALGGNPSSGLSAFTPRRRAASDTDPPKGRAASCAFVTSDGKVLLLKRSADEENWPNHWSLPGGRCEDDETPAQGAQRECGEEIGDCAFDGMREHETKRTSFGWDHTTFLVPSDSEFEPKLNAEHSDFGWHYPDELPSPMHPAVREMLSGEPSVTEPEGGKDMEPGKIQQLIAFLREFFTEEAAEPEHREAGDAIVHDPKSGQFTSAGHESSAKRHGNEAEWHNSKVTRHDISHRNAANAHTEAQLAHQRAAKSGVIEHSRGAEAASSRANRESERLSPLKSTGHEIANRLNSMGKAKDDWHPEAVARSTRPEETNSEKLGPGAHDTYRWRSPRYGGAKGASDAALAMDWAEAGLRDHDAGQATALAFDKESMREVDGDGRLHVNDANICMARVDEYLGSEIPDADKLNLKPDKKYKLWRNPEELEKAVDSFNQLPILNKHVAIDADTHDPNLVVGSTGSNSHWEPPFIKSNLVFWPRTAIDDIETNRRRELSPGYRYRADMTPGVTPDGDRYDGVMRDIGGSHLAQVQEGRQGKQIVVGDAALSTNHAYGWRSPQWNARSKTEVKV